MPEGTRSRNQSINYPCREYKSECKDSCFSRFACGTWYHSGMCFGIAASNLSWLTNQSALIWLCKNCQECAKSKLKRTDQNFEIHSKATEVEKK